ncbi:MAG TPA: DNA mismatch repair endonuclease MutL [Candidatus Fimivicinus intestinavium]|nr:DNA mismatch repair endonuclease MutL [Candidatus Fimivicinus intestinavium]
MPKIHVLPRHVAELIAAGEVVERPSSAVKELLENAIDAGASAITLEIKRGGITYIRITDNGCGIAREDAPAAFISHATSKISREEDLNGIGTLGFRGEALASIAAVSRVELLTRAQEEAMGTRLCIEGGEQTLLDDAGCPKGTTLIVRDLFYNTPARMKFLKKDVAEANAVAGVVDRVALSHPEVSVRFIRDGKEALLTPGDGKLLSAIYAVYGREFAQGLLPLDYALNGVQVSGFVAKPLAARPNRTMQLFFLNGRLVKSRTAMAALEEAYRHAIMAGKFPACVMHLHMPNEAVDVNVHPAKIEVRFVNERRVFDAVYYAVKNTLQHNDPRPQVSLNRMSAPVEPAGPPVPEQMALPANKQAQKASFWGHEAAASAGGSRPSQRLQSPAQAYAHGREPDTVEAALAKRAPEMAARFPSHTSAAAPAAEQRAEKPEPSFGRAAGAAQAEFAQEMAPEDIAVQTRVEKKAPGGRETAAKPAALLPDFRVIGEAFRTYIIVERGKELLLIDKHAAHERMLYEQLRQGGGQEALQLLLAPVAVTLSKEAYAAVLQDLELLRQAGFEAEDFGGGTILVRACPMALAQEDIAALLEELAGYLLANRRNLIPEKLDWLYHNVACRAAIKAGDETSPYELERFVSNLLMHDEIRYCPHGRPVLVVMSQAELEKQFGRIQ